MGYTLINGLSFAEIYIAAGTTAQTTNASAGTFDTVTGFASDGANGTSNDCTADKANNKITCTRAGKYLVIAAISFSGTANTTFEVQAHNITTDTAQPQVHLERKIGAGGDIGAAHCSGIVSAAANDEFVLKVAADGNSASFTPRDANLVMLRVGD